MYIYKLVPNGYNKFEKGMKKRYKSILLFCNEMKREILEIQGRKKKRMLKIEFLCSVYIVTVWFIFL
jgi:hypothetical protein